VLAGRVDKGGITIGITREDTNVFGFDDFIKFMQAFFIVLPIVTLIHVAGHVFFAGIFGGKGLKVIIGCGKNLFSFKYLEVKRFYFWYSGCEFQSLKYENKISLSFIYLGGTLFNLISIFLINYLIGSGVLEASLLWYQFIYFSFYFVFFALFPMDFPDGNPSDGKAFYRIIRDKKVDSTDDCQWKVE
jgi:hypothetical protein